MKERGSNLHLGKSCFATHLSCSGGGENGGGEIGGDGGELQGVSIWTAGDEFIPCIEIVL